MNGTAEQSYLSMLHTVCWTLKNGSTVVLKMPKMELLLKMF